MNQGLNKDFLHLKRYSTEEKVVGIWVDAEGNKKTIYERSFSHFYTDGDVVMSGVNLIINFFGQCTVTHGRSLPFFAYGGVNGDKNSSVTITKQYNSSDVVINLMANGQSTARQCDFTIQYTKV